MARYLATAKFRTPAGAAHATAQYQAVANAWLSWSPPEGFTLEHLWISADFSTGYNIWSTEDPTKLGEVVAYFLPHLDYSITPLLEPDQLITAWAAGGLIQLPG